MMQALTRTALSLTRGAVSAHTSWDADEALTELYTMHYASLVRLAALLLHDRDGAEEVVQDSFVAMHGTWRRLRDPDAGLAYLRRAVVNRSRSALRRRRTAEKYAPTPMTDGASAEHRALSRLDHDDLLAALRKLPHRQREVLVLRYYLDLAETDIASALGITGGSVKTHASRGMTALRTALETTP
jgi:RNA polymerase sigma-70 factor (sigma-E family)